MRANVVVSVIVEEGGGRVPGGERRQEVEKGSKKTQGVTRKDRNGRGVQKRQKRQRRPGKTGKA